MIQETITSSGLCNIRTSYIFHAYAFVFPNTNFWMIFPPLLKKNTLPPIDNY